MKIIVDLEPNGYYYAYGVVIMDDNYDGAPDANSAQGIGLTETQAVIDLLKQLHPQDVLSANLSGSEACGDDEGVMYHDGENWTRTPLPRAEALRVDGTIYYKAWFETLEEDLF